MITIYQIRVLWLIEIVFIATSAILFLLNLKKFKSGYWKWFVAFLVIEAFSESLLFIQEIFKINGFSWKYIYSYFLFPINFLIIYFLFYKYFYSSKVHYLALFAAVVYLLAFFLNCFIFKEKGFAEFWFSYKIGEYFLLFLCFLFFLFDTNDLPPKRNPMFWVVLGVSVFFSITCTLRGLNLKNFNLIDLYIPFIFNSIMYLFFSIAAIWGKGN